LLRSSLPGIGLSAAVVAVTLAIYGSSGDDPRQPSSAAVEGPASPLALPPPLTTRGPLPVAIGQGGDGAGGGGTPGGSLFVPVVFPQPAVLPTAPRPAGGGRGERPDRGAGRRDRRPGKRGDQRGKGETGVNQGRSPVLSVAQPAKPQPPANNGNPKPRPPKPAAPVTRTPPGQARRLSKPVPPGHAKKQAAPPAPAPAPAPAPRPAKAAKPMPPGQAKKQAAPAPAPPAAPAAPPATTCAPAGNGNGKAKGRC